MRKVLCTSVTGLFIASLIAVTLAAVGCSNGSSPTAPGSVAGITDGGGLSGPDRQPGPCSNGGCKNTQNLTLGVITFKPVLTYIVGATVTVKDPVTKAILAQATTHRRGDVDFHIPDTYSSILVDVTASGYCPATDVFFTLPVGAAYWIPLTPGC